MVSVNKKILKDKEGKEYRFNYQKFQNCVKEYKACKRSNKEKCTNDMVFELISEKVGLTYDAVRNWYYNHNGPSDIDIIDDIASVLEVEMYDMLDSLSIVVPQISLKEERTQLKEIKDALAKEIESRLVKLSISEGDSEEITKSIIRDMLDYINQMGKTDCFSYVPGVSNTWWDTQSYFLQWGNEIRLKMNKAAFSLSITHYRKLDQLLSELMMLTCDADYSQRWSSINPCFEYFYFQFQEDIGDLSYEDLFGVFEPEYIEFGMSEALKEELDKDIMPFVDEGFMVSMPIEKIVSMRVGTWFMDIVRHDFPELFE